MSAIEHNGLHELAAAADAAALGIAPTVRAITVRAATNVKATMRADMQEHVHFRAIAQDIDFDTIESRDAIIAEIGPRHGAGHPGNLANIAYFGAPRGGGGEVRDPLDALEEERPAFEAYIADAATAALR